ncbi:MAG: amidohydrolase family protein [Pseudomonadota bacterium]
MIIDSHVHLFSPSVVANVSKRQDMVSLLRLEIHEAPRRSEPGVLASEAREAGLDAVLLLPTANAASIARVNQEFIREAGLYDRVFTAGTLHPVAGGIREELERFREHKVRAVKICSFSQGFVLTDPDTLAMFREMAVFSRDRNYPLTVILDTFALAHQYFHSDPTFTTTPDQVGFLVREFADLNFVAAHMGGLCAPFDQVVNCLPPSRNLFLDTANGAHVLSRDEFVFLLRRHGPGHVLFGTDWPYFGFTQELALVDSLAEQAGFSAGDRDLLAGDNSRDLFLP